MYESSAGMRSPYSDNHGNFRLESAKAIWFVSGKQLQQVIVKDAPRDIFLSADFVQSFTLRFEDLRIPAPWKIRRIRAKKQPLWPGDV